MEYYSAVIKKEILPFVTAWIDLESIMVSEAIQSEKHKYHIISLICKSNEQNKTNKQNRNRLIDKE